MTTTDSGQRCGNEFLAVANMKQKEKRVCLVCVSNNDGQGYCREDPLPLQEDTTKERFKARTWSAYCVRWALGTREKGVSVPLMLASFTLRILYLLMKTGKTPQKKLLSGRFLYKYFRFGSFITYVYAKYFRGSTSVSVDTIRLHFVLFCFIYVSIKLSPDDKRKKRR